MSFSFLTKNIATFANSVKYFLVGFLLKEDSDYILTEDGGKIILDESTPYSFQTKNTS